MSKEWGHNYGRNAYGWWQCERCGVIPLDVSEQAFDCADAVRDMAVSEMAGRP